MLESFSISADCAAYLSNKTAAIKMLKKSLRAYARRSTKNSDGVVVKSEYEVEIQKIVRDVFAKTDPSLKDLVETKVAWAQFYPTDNVVHIQLTACLRSLHNTYEYLTLYH